MQTSPVNPRNAPSQSHHENQKQWAFFGRIWSEEQTTLFLLGIPVIRKEKTSEQDVLRLLGIPMVKIQYEQFEKKTLFLGIPISSRPNYRYLERRINESVNRLHSISGAPIAARSNKTISLSLQDARELLNKLPSYQLICDARDGRLILEDELTIVTKQMEKLLASEGRIDG